MTEEAIELRGHIIDSLLLPKVLDRILAHGAGYEIEQLDIGVRRSDPSHACIRIRTEDNAGMDQLLAVLKLHGAEVVERQDARLAAADMEGAFPEGFYATTSLRTEVRLQGEWIEVQNQEMDCGIVVDPAGRQAFCTPMHRILRGDQVITGHRGVRVIPREQLAQGHRFEFMGSDISPEKPKPAMVREVARALWQCREEKKKTLFVGGPAIVHTGGSEYLAYLVREGFVGVLFAGNGLAVHDMENAFFGTSLGIRLQGGPPIRGGHRNHLRTINTIRRSGGIRAAAESGLLTSGIMHACISRGVPFVLAGSIRDDGPLPEVVTDTVAAVDLMRRHVRGTSLALLVASTLHGVATGNILPAETRIAAVDISSASLTKLMDRGSLQTIGIVSDAGLFLRELAEELRGGCAP